MVRGKTKIKRDGKGRKGAAYLIFWAVSRIGYVHALLRKRRFVYGSALNYGTPAAGTLQGTGGLFSGLR